MQASTSTPSVLAQPAEIMTSPMDAYPMNAHHERSDSPNRRQRISMACQYCRHRKIRCCGGSPCRNCTRSQRECEYAPVPEEVNRATREKKAIAKATKTSHYASPATTYSPFFADTPVFDLPYVDTTPMRPTHLGHRRSVSVPNFDVSPWSQPPPSAPLLNSPAMFESAQWMYNGWSTGPPVPQVSSFPSVLEQVAPPPHSHSHSHSHQYLPQTPPESYSSSQAHSLSSNEDMSSPLVPLPVSWSTPNLHLRVPALTPGQHQHQNQHRTAPHSPVTPIYYSPHPTPPVYYQQPQQMFSPSPLGQQANTSPTLAPEMALPTKDLVGLGIGMGMSMGMQEVEMLHTPTYLPDEYMSQF